MSHASDCDSGKMTSEDSSEEHPLPPKKVSLSMPSESSHEEDPSKLLALDFRSRPSIEHDENFPFSSTFHGISHIFEQRYGTRTILWILLIATAITGCFAFIIIQVVRYFEFHSTTKTTLVYANRLEFPAITICNYNSFRRSALTANDLVHMAYLVKAYGLDNGALSKLLTAEEKKKLIEYWKKYDHTHSEKFNYQLFVERVGYHASDMIKSCHFGVQECGPKNFSNVLTTYGNCITFNSDDVGKALTQKFPGSNHGLKLLINIQEYEYTGSYRTDRLDIGIKFVVHEKNYPPDVFEQGKAVGPGSHAYASVKYRTINNLPAPYGECSSRKLPFYKEYTYAGCHISCKTNFIKSKCGCRAPDMPGVNIIPVCSPQKMLQCVSPNLVKFQRKETKICDCPIPCFTAHYDTTISYAKIPNPQMAKSLAATMNKTEFMEETHGLVDPDISPRLYISQNYLLLNIFFDDLFFQETIATPVTSFSSLLGDIGGQLGLFVGASLLTIAEIVECGFYRSRGAVRRYQHDKKQRMSDTGKETSCAEKEPLVDNGKTSLPS